MLIKGIMKGGNGTSAVLKGCCMITWSTIIFKIHGTARAGKIDTRAMSSLQINRPLTPFTNPKDLEISVSTCRRSISESVSTRSS